MVQMQTGSLAEYPESLRARASATVAALDVEVRWPLRSHESLESRSDALCADHAIFSGMGSFYLERTDANRNSRREILQHMAVEDTCVPKGGRSSGSGETALQDKLLRSKKERKQKET